MDFDLAALKTTSTARPLKLIHPGTGVPLMREDKPVTLMIRSPQSKELRALAREVQNQRLTQAQRLGRMQLTAEEIEEETIQRLALAICGWDNLHMSGAELSYSPEAARGLVRDFAWIRDQVDAFLRNDGNFLEGSILH